MLRALLLHCVCLSVSTHGLLQCMEELEEGGLLLECLDQGGIDCILMAWQGTKGISITTQHTHIPHTPLDELEEGGLLLECLDQGGIE